jgi:Xaa-Pro aminopeptidase
LKFPPIKPEGISWPAHVKNGIILLLGNDESPMNYKDNTLPFRQDSTFLYFIGLQKTNLASIIDCENGESYLFGDDPSIDEIVWTGPQKSLQELGEMVGIDRTYAFAKLKDKLQEALEIKSQDTFPQPIPARSKDSAT